MTDEPTGTKVHKRPHRSTSGVGPVNALVVYYSRTGTTKKVARAISDFLEADLDTLIDAKKRRGIIGWLRAGRDAMKGALTTIHGDEHDPARYDLVLLGTPVWAGTMSAATRTYITHYCDQLGPVAFFATCGKETKHTFPQMAELAETSPVETLELRAKTVKNGEYLKRVKSFTGALGASK